MGVSKNNGAPKSSILIGVSIMTIHFGVPLFLETPMYPIYLFYNVKRRQANVIFVRHQSGFVGMFFYIPKS